MLKNLWALLKFFLEGMPNILPWIIGFALYQWFRHRDAYSWEELVIFTLVAGVASSVARFMILVVKHERDYRADYDKRSIYRNEGGAKEKEGNTE